MTSLYIKRDLPSGFNSSRTGKSPSEQIIQQPGERKARRVHGVQGPLKRYLLVIEKAMEKYHVFIGRSAINMDNMAMLNSKLLTENQRVAIYWRYLAYFSGPNFRRYGLQTCGFIWY